MPSSEEKEYEKWLDGCTPFNEMPYFNESSNTYDCFPVLDVGPCKPKEWFVLDKDNPQKAICKEQKCACGPVSEYSYDYENESDDSHLDSEAECTNDIEKNGYNFLDFNDDCFEVKDTQPCPFGQWLLPDSFGDGK